VIEEIAARLDRGVDDKQWDVVRAAFADNVEVDIGAVSGKEKVVMTGDAFCAEVVALNPPDKKAYHSRVNVITTIDGDRATVTAQCYGWNDCPLFDPSVYEVWGAMTHGFVRTSQGWRIDRTRMEKWREAGNAEVSNYRGVGK
ncbi:MAG: nuclear transport factor 2 family protein, partial [Caulobacterales bacterium]